MKQFEHLIFLLNLLIYSVIVKFSAHIAVVFFVFEFVFTKNKIKIIKNKNLHNQNKKIFQIRQTTAFGKIE